MEGKSALKHIAGITSIIFNLFTLGQMQPGGYSSCCMGKESGPIYFSSPRYYRVTLYWRILTSQMDVMAVFCIICSPIHVMLCKSELEVDGCNLKGSLAYVYLRSSFVHSEDKARSGEPGGCWSSSARLRCGLLQTTPPPGLGPPARRGGAAWSSALTRAWVALQDGLHRSLRRSGA